MTEIIQDTDEETIDIVPVEVDATIYQVNPSYLNWPGESWARFCDAVTSRFTDVTDMWRDGPAEEFWITTGEPFHEVAPILTQLRENALQEEANKARLPACTLSEHIYEIHLPEGVSLEPHQWNWFIDRLHDLPLVHTVGVRAPNHAISLYADPRANITPTVIQGLIAAIQGV